MRRCLPAPARARARGERRARGRERRGWGAAGERDAWGAPASRSEGEEVERESARCRLRRLRRCLPTSPWLSAVHRCVLSARPSRRGSAGSSIRGSARGSALGSIKHSSHRSGSDRLIRARAAHQQATACVEVHRLGAEQSAGAQKVRRALSGLVRAWCAGAAFVAMWACGQQQ